MCPKKNNFYTSGWMKHNDERLVLGSLLVSRLEAPNWVMDHTSQHQQPTAGETEGP